MDEPDKGSESVAAAERSCKLGSGAGCANLAFLYATGKFVKKDDHRATALYKKACDLGDAQGCYNAALMADEGRGGAHDVARAVAGYEEACTLGSTTGCTNLGFLYEKGRGVTTDKSRAVALYRRGCEGTSCQPSNLGGCVNLGRAYRDGIGVEVDEPRAAAIFREACDRDAQPRRRPLLRERLARLFAPRRPLHRRRWHSEGPDEGARAVGARVRQRRLVRLLQRGGRLLRRRGRGAATRRRPPPILDLACKGGDGEGCFDLGVAYEKGNGVTRDRHRAVEFFRRACQLGFSEACAKK